MYSRFSAWLRFHHRTVFRKFSGFRTSDELSFGPTLWIKYLKLLQERPILTKSLTSGLLSFSADFICQRWELQRAANRVQDNDGKDVGHADLKTVPSFDWLRASRFTLLGSVLVAPVLHVWYGFLARFIPGPLMVDAMKRLLLDQLLFAPAFIPIFFSANLLLEGRPELIKEKIERDLWHTVFTNYAVWIPAQFVNFSVIRPTLQVLFSNFVGFFWNIYFSYAANRSIAAKNVEEPIVRQRIVAIENETLDSNATVAIDESSLLSQDTSEFAENSSQKMLSENKVCDIHEVNTEVKDDIDQNDFINGIAVPSTDNSCCEGSASLNDNNSNTDISTNLPGQFLPDDQLNVTAVENENNESEVKRTTVSQNVQGQDSMELQSSSTSDILLERLVADVDESDMNKAIDHTNLAPTVTLSGLSRSDESVLNKVPPPSE